MHTKRFKPDTLRGTVCRLLDRRLPVDPQRERFDDGQPNADFKKKFFTSIHLLQCIGEICLLAKSTESSMNQLKEHNDEIKRSPGLQNIIRTAVRHSNRSSNLVLWP